MTEQELMYASHEDQVFYLQCVNGLPGIEGFSKDGLDSNGRPMDYGVGAHSVRCFREIVEIAKPTSILEIGLNCGYSSALWLNMTDAKVLSVDISDRAETLEAGRILSKKFDPRFFYVISDSAVLLKNHSEDLAHYGFDLTFIDGGHLEHHVISDIELALALNIKWLAFDDILPQFGPGVLPAIAKFPQLKEVKTMGNIALYQNTEV